MRVRERIRGLAYGVFRRCKSSTLGIWFCVHWPGVDVPLKLTKREARFRYGRQVPEEIEGLAQWLANRGVRSLLEIGSFEGFSMRYLLESIPTLEKATVIDLPGGPWGKEQAERTLRETVAGVQEAGFDVELLLGDSKDPDIFAAAHERGPYDVVFIDGDHTYAGVKGDFELYSPDGRYIVFHDIVGEGCFNKRTGAVVEVPRFWREISESGKESEEFVAEGSQMGIGVLDLG